MSACQKRTRRFLRQGNVVNTRYLADLLGGQDGDLDMDGSLGDRNGAGGGRTMKLNFFHTNIQTLQAQLYGAVPKIDVKREYDDPNDDVGRVAAEIFQRMLQSEVESSGEEFPTALRSALQDRLLPGLGVCRVRYDFETTMEPSLDPMTMEVTETEQIAYEDAPTDYVHWQDFRWGWCRT